MNNLRNRVQLIGHPGMDPDVKEFEKGGKLAKFSIATNETYKNNKGEKITETQWHNTVSWGKTAELVEKYVRKGKEVALEGKLVTRNYETDKGEKKYITEVVVNEILLLNGKS